MQPADEVQPEFDDEQLDVLSRFGRREVVEAGQVLFRPGDPVHDLYVVHRGLVAVLDRSEDDERLVIAHGPRTLVGELDLLTGQRAFLEGRVLLDSELQVLSPVELRQLLATEADLGDLILATLIARRDALQVHAASSLVVAGRRRGAPTLRLREFLTRNRVPHRWVDEEPELSQFLTRHDLTDQHLPAVHSNGVLLSGVTPGTLAEHLGLTLRGEVAERVLDVVVVGAGPSGLAAAVYAASEGLDTMVVESTAPGGQAGTSARIENYLGFPRGVSGAELTDRAMTQALKFGAAFSTPCDVVALRSVDGVLEVGLASGEQVRSRAVVAATGARYRRLPVDGLERFEGNGVFYAATAVEARLVAERPVVVVGGGNSAGQAALHLAGHCSHVHLVVRGDDLGASMSSYLTDRIVASQDIDVHLRTEVSALLGDDRLRSSMLVGPDGSIEVESSGLFSFVGASPTASWLSGNARTDDHGFVLTCRSLDPSGLDPQWQALGRVPLPYETSQPGVFAVGDLRAGSTKRVAAAVGEGAEVIRSVHQHLARPARPPATGAG